MTPSNESSPRDESPADSSANRDGSDRDEAGKDGPEKENRSERPRQRSRGLLFVAIAMVVVVSLAALTQGPGGAVESNFYIARDWLVEGRLEPKDWVFYRENMTFSARVSDPKKGEPKSIEVRFVNDDQVTQFRRDAIEVYNRDRELTVDWEVKDVLLWRILLNYFFWVLLIVVLYFFLARQLRGAGQGGGLFSFGKSRAKIASQSATGVSFADVAGIDEAKGEVSEIVEFLQDPGRFHKLGGRIPRGILLIGSPGTGKTLLARAIAGEANVPFFSISGSDFVEMFVGVGAARVRDLFRQARDKSPCIVFLDEIDAVGRRRGSGIGGGHDEREQTLNAILVEMDGFEASEGIILLAATNRPDVLDPALLRPGRFDREIRIDLPDCGGREKILEVHAAKTAMDASVDLHRIARVTVGFSGAEIAALVNESAISAALHDQETILMKDLEEARDKILWGRSKKSRRMDEDDRRITAYHEAGHALIAHLLDEVEPLHKVTIIPRGPSLGSTMQLPEKDRHHLSRKQILGNLVLLYAGRAAETLFCDDVTSGAESDLNRATSLARRMICEWGMSEAVGPIQYLQAGGDASQGIPSSPTYSEAFAKRIDEEVQAIAEQSYEKAERLLSEQREAVERVVEMLLEKETLSGEDVAALVENRPLEVS